jgi:hypothetical protein
VSDSEKGNLANMEEKLEEDTVCAENCEACDKAMILIHIRSNTEPSSSNCVLSLRIVCLAGAHLVLKCTRKRLCVTITLFMSAKKTSKLLLSVRQSASHCLPSYKMTCYNCITGRTVFCCQLQQFSWTTAFPVKV